MYLDLLSEFIGTSTCTRRTSNFWKSVVLQRAMFDKCYAQPNWTNPVNLPRTVAMAMVGWFHTVYTRNHDVYTSNGYAFSVKLPPRLLGDIADRYVIAQNIIN